MRVRNNEQKYIISIVHKSKFLLYVQYDAQHWTEYKISSMHLFLTAGIFIPDTYGTKTGDRKWSQFMVPVCGVCVMSINLKDSFALLSLERIFFYSLKCALSDFLLHSSHRS